VVVVSSALAVSVLAEWAQAVSLPVCSAPDSLDVDDLPALVLAAASV
jgi:hypothetical protein